MIRMESEQCLIHPGERVQFIQDGTTVLCNECVKVLDPHRLGSLQSLAELAGQEIARVDLLRENVAALQLEITSELHRNLQTLIDSLEAPSAKQLVHSTIVQGMAEYLRQDRMKVKGAFEELRGWLRAGVFKKQFANKVEQLWHSAKTDQGSGKLLRVCQRRRYCENIQQHCIALKNKLDFVGALASRQRPSLELLNVSLNDFNGFYAAVIEHCLRSGVSSSATPSLRVQVPPASQPAVEEDLNGLGSFTSQRGVDCGIEAQEPALNIPSSLPDPTSSFAHIPFVPKSSSNFTFPPIHAQQSQPEQELPSPFNPILNPGKRQQPSLNGGHQKLKRDLLWPYGTLPAVNQQSNVALTSTTAVGVQEHPATQVLELERSSVQSPVLNSVLAAGPVDQNKGPMPKLPTGRLAFNGTKDKATVLQDMNTTMTVTRIFQGTDSWTSKVGAIIGHLTLRHNLYKLELLDINLQAAGLSNDAALAELLPYVVAVPKLKFRGLVNDGPTLLRALGGLCASTSSGLSKISFESMHIYLNEDVMAALASAKQVAFTDCTLHFNSEERKCELGTLIERTSTIVRLKVKKCGLTDRDVVLFKRALKRNKSITHLDLSCNMLTLEGFTRLVLCCKHNITLRELRLKENYVSYDSIGPRIRDILAQRPVPLEAFVNASS